MSIFSRVGATLGALLRPDNYRRGAALQERADVLRLYLLATARERWPEVHERTIEDVEAEAPTVAKQRAAVLELAQTQALQMLDARGGKGPKRRQGGPAEPQGELA